ncbi:helix-turn-helix transcriptional regulator [Streptomyces sp. AS02]|uniref:helix-turn-helix transcriptional regulator n=1 Tax=Streptomyces sp. AS02 TaxID=2938946 RepID=UPI00202235C1|nr:helix-turn-helix transcriptional regulator [Streptomyces sp. AS02]MCL8011303.1 helix-turn-helix transcriptional regulator [Streptomyces sp. AS02]
MNRQEEVRTFLTTRRARVRPEQVGLQDFGGERRVPGLRRAEVARLAGVSVDYYTRLERGRIEGASDSVLQSVARALRLDDTERAHLFDLARGRGWTTMPGSRSASVYVRAPVRRVLDALHVPAVVRNARQDLIAANGLGRALYATPLDSSGQPANLARFIFLDPRSREFYPDWKRACRASAAALRSETVRSPADRDLRTLIDELRATSSTFTEVWANYDVHLQHTGEERLRHPAVGEMTLPFEVLAVPADRRLSIVAYSAEPGTPADNALAHLAAWADGLSEPARLAP